MRERLLNLPDRNDDMIRIGPGGTGGLGFELGLERIYELGLSALEVEFTHGITMKNETAKTVGNIAKKLGISLSIHSPYFVNLASAEKPKIIASKQRILQSCERMHHMGGGHVVFHPAYFGKVDAKDVYDMVKDAVVEMMGEIKDKGWNVILAMETTGKHSAFGSLEETISIVKETGCAFTIDFAHLKARSAGQMSYAEMLDKIKGFKHIHSHFSGIEWTSKGEKGHILTPEKDMRELLSEVVKRKLDITIINESPDVIGDAYKMKKILDSLH